MANPYQASLDELISIDAGAAAWTILFPAAPISGDKFTVRTTTLSDDFITFDGNGKNIESVVFGSSAPTISIPLAGGALTVVFAAERDVWVVSSGYSPNVPQYDPTVYNQGGTPPLAITVAPIIIPLAFGLGDTDRFTLEANGTLTVINDIPQVNVSGNVLFSMFANANNQEANIRLEFALTAGGTGIMLDVPSVFPFQTSRTGTFLVTTKTEAIFASLQTGDSIQLQASILVGDTMTTDATDTLAFFEESDII